ncbi:MAG: cysteine lyase [Cyanobacteria bacterium QS_8_64_29]|nr:MAG: cysteine lyase [Cyanobacteria bacterium QS_8_64_29]
MTSTSPSVARLEQHRQQFPGLQAKAYFNFGAQGVLPQGALEAIQQTYAEIEWQGPFGGQVNAWLADETERTRAAIAAELGATPETIALTENVTAGCNIALWGLAWQAGDHLLLTDCEHPGIIAAAREIARRFGVKIDTCPIAETLNGGDPVAAIEQALQPRTRLVVLSHLLWNTGQLLPLRDIATACHAQGTRVLVDAAQSAGSLPLDLTDLGADFYAFTGHKWFCGPAGVGGLYVRPEAFEALQPTFVGWRGIELDRRGQPQDWQPDARRFEVATSAYPQYVGLRHAIATHRAWGTAQQRYAQIGQGSAYLWEQLARLEGVRCLRSAPPEAGLVSFQLAGQAHQPMVDALEQQGFLLRTLKDPPCIRACVHYLTLPAELDRLVAAIAQQLAA